MPTSSANPHRLAAAARAVPLDVKATLDAAPRALAGEMDDFAGAEQVPDLVAVDTELPRAVQDAVLAGGSIDTFLARVAAAFFDADGTDVAGTPGYTIVDDSVLATALSAWDRPRETEVRRRDDGRVEVRGPDGRWYLVADSPPPGAVPLGPPQEDTVDFGNPDLGLVISASTIVMGNSQPILRAAPPATYDHIHFDDDGNLVVGDDPGDPLPGRSPVMGDPGPPDTPRGAAAEGLQGVLAGLSAHASARYRNVYRTQTTFYVDPRTGERIAVVDAASVAYDDDGNAHVVAGRLTRDERGRLTLGRRPSTPGEPCRTEPDGLERREIPAPEDN